MIAIYLFLIYLYEKVKSKMLPSKPIQHLSFSLHFQEIFPLFFHISQNNFVSLWSDFK